jgi:hypothetical protein
MCWIQVHSLRARARLNGREYQSHQRLSSEKDSGDASDDDSEEIRVISTENLLDDSGAFDSRELKVQALEFISKRVVLDP